MTAVRTAALLPALACALCAAMPLGAVLDDCDGTVSELLMAGAVTLVMLVHHTSKGSKKESGSQ